MDRLPTLRHAEEVFAQRAALDVGTLAERVRATGQRWCAAARAERLELEPPEAMLRGLAMRVELERRDDSPESRERAALILEYATETLPALYLETYASRDAEVSWLFHTPVPWSRLPRLWGALDALATQLVTAGAAASSERCRPDEGATLFDLFRRCFFGRYAPMFATYPDDVALLKLELAQARDRWEVVDRRLSAAMLHEHPHAIVLDTETSAASCASAGDGYEIAAPLHLVPPALAAAWRAAGVRSYRIELHDVASVPDLVELLLGGEPGSGSRPGFSLEVARGQIP